MLTRSWILGIAVAMVVLISVGMALQAGPVIAGTHGASPTPDPSKKNSKRLSALEIAEFDGNPIERTDNEWRRLLTPFQFYILREDGTEKPYSSPLNSNKRRGTYHCAACGLVLFRSAQKYDSRTGWPSFFAPAFAKNLLEKEDRSLEEVRTEVECARCGGHLGHVFDDGPQPTGLRYCINGAALRFKPSR